MAGWVGHPAPKVQPLDKTGAAFHDRLALAPPTREMRQRPSRRVTLEPEPAEALVIAEIFDLFILLLEAWGPRAEP